MTDEDGTLSEAPQEKDWIHDLFPMKASSAGSEDAFSKEGLAFPEDILKKLQSLDASLKIEALNEIKALLTNNRALATESNLRLVLKMLKDENWDVSKKALEAISSFFEANKALATESNLSSVLEILKDENWDVSFKALKAIPSFIQANKAAFTGSNLRLVLEMLKDEKWDVRSPALKAIPSFIQADNAFATESNLRLVLEMLKDENWDVRGNALEALPSFIEANKAAFTESNLRLVLEMLKDKDEGVCNNALEALPSFIEANKAAFTESNLRLVLEVLKDENEDVRYSALKAIPSFIQANKAAFTESNLNSALKMLDDKEKYVRYSALEAIPSFIQANKALATESNLNSALKMLDDKEKYVRYLALEVIPSFIQANKALATESNLNSILEMLKDEGPDVRSKALEVIPSFIQANKAAFTESNLNSVLKMLKDKESYSALKAIPSFIQANKAAFTESNLSSVLKMLKDEGPDVRYSALEAIPSFIQANKALATESNLSSILEMLKDEGPGVRSKALEAIPSFIQANKALATESNLNSVLKMLKDEDSRVRPFAVGVRSKALKAIPSFIQANKAAFTESNLRLVLKMLKDKDWDARGNALEALPSFIQANNALATESNLNSVLKMLKDEGPDVRSKALEVIPSFIQANKAAFTESNTKLLILSRDLALVNQLSKEYPDLFKDLEWMSSIKRLFSFLGKEAQTRAEAERETFLEALYKTIGSYTKLAVAEDDFDRLIEEYNEVASFLDIVHDNLFLCLYSLGNIGISLRRFKSLRKELSFNNPLTRIIRMLGEEKGNVGGYSDVTKKIISSGGFGYLYEIILEIAKKKQRNAPQEISGLLEVLREVPEEDLKNWGNDGWQSLTSDIEDYYSQGFKVMTYSLFKYFREHKDDKLLLTSLREDIERELGNIAWGGFKGLSDEFKERYNLSAVDELGIIAKFIPIANLSGRDYEGKYLKIKKALLERNTWTQEVDQVLRTPYSFKRTQSSVIYQPQDEKDTQERVSLQKSLTTYCAKSDNDLQAIINKHRINNPNATDKEDLKKVILSFIQKRRGIDLNYLSKEPALDSEAERWLSIWHKVLSDTWKQDLNNDIQALVENTAKVKGEQRERIISETISFIINIFSDDIRAIEKQLSLYRSIERETEYRYYVGFFDDLLHIMAFMMTGVCTWIDRDRQVTDTRYHFGKIAVKEPSGRLLGSSQVQLLRCSIDGLPASSTANGWKVLALPGINLYEGEIGLSREKAVLAILQAAQKLAKESGMQGAVIPQNATIHSNHPFEKNLIAKLAEKGHLKKLTLTETITLSEKPTYSYKDVYLLQIPEDEIFITLASQEDRISDEKERSARLQNEDSFVFGEGFGEVVIAKGRDGIVKKVKEQAERMLKLLPEDIEQDLRTIISLDDISVRIKIEKTLAKSYINKTEDSKEITLFLGEDILYEDNKIDSLTLDELFSEILAALLLKDYHILKEESLHNENSYFKLNLIKALLNYKSYLRGYHKTINRYAWGKQNFLDEKTPAEQSELLDRYRIQLNEYTKDYTDISQWNIFLNIMDGADPDFIIYNYIHMLVVNLPTTDEDISAIIDKIRNQDIGDKPSIARLREIVKELLFDGKVRLKILGQTKEKEEFSTFDRKQSLQQLHDTLLTATSRDTYYQAWRAILSNTLTLSEEELTQELSQLIEKDLFSSIPRQETVISTLEEILTRRIGKTALVALKEHLSAQRGFKQIPYIKISHLELAEGVNADDYEFLFYETQGDEPRDYVLMTDEDGTLSEAPQEKDWIHDLFPMKASSAGKISGTDTLHMPSEALSDALREHKVIISISQAA
jgi:HEAT repeat protein